MNTTGNKNGIWIMAAVAVVLTIGAVVWVVYMPTKSSPPREDPQGKPAETTTPGNGHDAPGKVQPTIVRATPDRSAKSEASATQSSASVSPEKKFPTPPPVSLQQPTVQLSKTRLKQLNKGLTTRTGTPAVDGELALAHVSVESGTYDLTPNQVGNFQRVHVSGLDTIAAEVRYPQAREGETVVVSVLDGGKLDDGAQARKQVLGADRKFAFHFQVTDQLGIHRVRLTKGADQKILDFWVGEVPPPAKPITQAMNNVGGR